jgi:hypothetical protein
MHTPLRACVCLFVLGGCGTGRVLDASDATALFPPDAAPSATDAAATFSPDAANSPSDASQANEIDAGPTVDAGPYTVVDQPPASSNFFYPGEFAAKPIQSAGSGGPLVEGHLMPNSDAVIQTITQYNKTTGQPPGPQTYACGRSTCWSGGFVTGAFASPGGDDLGSMPIYYAKMSDPVYRVTNVPYPNGCGPNFAPLATNKGGYIGNLVFHAPLQAQTSGAGSSASDTALGIWDLSGDASDISDGHAIGFYYYGAFTLPLPGSHAGTMQDPIPFAAGGQDAYCAWDNPSSPSQQGQWGSGSGGNGSNEPGVFGNLNRLSEVLSGQIHHAGQGNVACEATAGGAEPNAVFPSKSGGALKCTDQSAMAPPNGSHYFMDYTTDQLNCMNPSMPSCTGADGNPITKLDSFHYTLIEQLTSYGWFESDTGGPASDPTNGGLGSWSFYHVESSQPYVYYEANGYIDPDPLTGTCPYCYQTFESYMKAHCPIPEASPMPDSQECYDAQRASPDSAHQWTTRMLNNISGNIPGPGNGAYGCSLAQSKAGNCGPGFHLHIADPCVDVAAAGLSSYGRWTACP